MISPLKWKLKKIDPSTPLFDDTTKTYTIVVEGELVEIPEETFLKLFKWFEAPYGEVPIPMLLNEKADREWMRMKEQLKGMMKDGMSKEEIIAGILRAGSMYGISVEKAKSVLEQQLREIEKEGG